MKNRNFSYRGINFHLNDNSDSPLIEYEGKYKLVYWHDGHQRWQKCTTVDTKKEAVEYVKRNFVFL